MNSLFFPKKTVFIIHSIFLGILVAAFLLVGGIARAEEDLLEFTLEPPENYSLGVEVVDAEEMTLPEAVMPEMATQEMALPEAVLPEAVLPEEVAVDSPALDASLPPAKTHGLGEILEKEPENAAEVGVIEPPVGSAAVMENLISKKLREPELSVSPAEPEVKKMPSPPPFVSSRTRETELVRAIHQARPAVVNICGEKMVKQPVYDASGGEMDPPQPVNGMGTGVIIDPRGYIATNFHVVDGVRQIQVTTADQKSYVARLLARDKVTDLAIIKIDPDENDPPFQTITIGTSSDLMTGETVIAVGNAFGYEHTVTRGIISALNRSVKVSKVQLYENLIQTDASINPGNSGGPLLNIDGEMIGINVAVRDGAQGIGFAIPVDNAMRVITRMILVQSDHRHWTGMTFADYRMSTSSGRISDAQPGQPSAAGVKIQAVEKNSPAEDAGLQAEDVLLAVDREKIGSPLDFVKSIMERPAGDSVEIYLSRDGRKWRTYLTLGRAVGSGGGGMAVAGSMGKPGVPENAVPSAAVGTNVDAADVEERRNTWTGRGGETSQNAAISPNTGIKNAAKSVSTDDPPGKAVWEVLGLNLSSVSPRRLGTQHASVYNGGLLVQSVCPDSVAQQLDIRPGDILLGILRWETLSVPHVQYILSEPDFYEAKTVNFLLLRGGALVSKKMMRE